MGFSMFVLGVVVGVPIGCALTVGGIFCCLFCLSMRRLQNGH